MAELIFSESPAITLATNTFVNVPVILQYEDTPLIEVVKTEKAGFTTQIPIYHPDGTYLAKVVGAQVYRTEDGKKVGLKLTHPKDMTVCSLGDQTLFELHRVGPAALRGRAELYTPDGAFVRCSSDEAKVMLEQRGKPLQIGNVTVQGNTFSGVKIGILVRGDGSIGIGVNRPPQ